jgi:membrane associated rhomboid family serine protease
MTESTARPSRRPPVTLVLIGLNVAYFLVMVIAGVSAFEPSSEQALRWGADFGPYTLDGQWWRIATSTFLHFGILHLALNMWALLNLGFVAELLFGRTTFLMIYVVSAVGGALASLLVHPLVVSAGASAAIFGVAGGVIMGLLLKRDNSALVIALRKSLRSLLTFVVWNLIGGMAIAGIDVMAHVGGLITGAACGAVVLLPAAAQRLRPRAWAAAVFTLFVIGLSLGAAGVKRADTPRILAALAQLDSTADADSVAVVLPSVAPRHSVPATIPARSSDDIAALEQAAAAHPESITPAIDLAAAYLRSARIPDAIATLERARGRAPGDARVLTSLGTAYLAAQRYDDAVNAFQAAFVRDSSNRDARYNLASARLERGQALAAAGARQRAAADFQQVLHLHADGALDSTAREGMRAKSHRS